MTESLTPEDAAELLRMDARARKRDSRARQAERAAAQERLIAEREAERLAVLAAKDERITALEARLADFDAAAASSMREIQSRLDDAVTYLACVYDIPYLVGRGLDIGIAQQVAVYLREAVSQRHRAVGSRTWTCTPTEATARGQAIMQSVKDRIGTLPDTDRPSTLARSVTPPDTPVTRTVHNADRHERIADRSHEPPAISADEQAWIDAQDRCPYDPYEAMIEHIEALAEGGVEDDMDDDGERF